MAKFEYAATVEVSGANYVAYNANGTQISGGTNFGTVANAAGAAVGYGTVFFRKGTYTATASSPVVPTAGNNFQGEGCHGQIASATLTAGTLFKGPSGSMGGPLINGTDVAGFTMDGIGVDANAQCTYCVIFSGWRSGASNCSFVKGSTAAVYFTDGASSTANTYVDMYFGPNNWVHQNGTATKGVLVSTSGAGTARPTDGRIFGNNRIWGARSGGIHVTAGHWIVTQNQVVSDTSATLGIYISSGHGAVVDNCVDSIGNGHFLEVDGSSTNVLNNRFLLASSGSGHAIMYDTSGSNLIFRDNHVDGNAGETFTYALEFAADPTTSRNILVSGLYTRLTAAATAISNYTSSATGYVYENTGHHA